MENVNSLSEEQKQAITQILEDLIEAFKQCWESIKKIIVQIWNKFKEIIKKNAKLKKCMIIYDRTRNKRIKKKQITRIRNILLE